MRTHGTAGRPAAGARRAIGSGVAPKQKAGSAAAISETSGEFGIALGVAVIGSVGAAVYRNQVSVPDGVPADAAAAAERSESDSEPAPAATEAGART